MKLLQDENDMLREKVVNLSCVPTKPCEVKTSGETTHNSSTEAAGQSKQTTPRALSKFTARRLIAGFPRNLKKSFFFIFKTFRMS